VFEPVFGVCHLVDRRPALNCTAAVSSTSSEAICMRSTRATLSRQQADGTRGVRLEWRRKTAQRSSTPKLFHRAARSGIFTH
jgi:hypothetical protein